MNLKSGKPFADSQIHTTLTIDELQRIEQAWQIETLRIAAEIDGGHMRLVPWEIARTEIFGEKKGP